MARTHTLNASHLGILRRDSGLLSNIMMTLLRTPVQKYMKYMKVVYAIQDH